MIQIVPQMRILVAVQPIDFRNGIDGLARRGKNEKKQKIKKRHAGLAFHEETCYVARHANVGALPAAGDH